MPFEFIQMPAKSQGDAKEALYQLLQGCHIASQLMEFVSHDEHSFWEFCVEYLTRPRLLAIRHHHMLE